MKGINASNNETNNRSPRPVIPAKAGTHSSAAPALEPGPTMGLGLRRGDNRVEKLNWRHVACA
jgi:hypothetical protein